VCPRYRSARVRASTERSTAVVPTADALVASNQLISRPRNPFAFASWFRWCTTGVRRAA
jgi:hypothetical protein